MNTIIEKTAQAIRSSNHICALTGAGISVESGIPPFRGKGGIWETIDPQEFAHIDSFIKNPGLVWKELLSLMKGVLDKARPNSAHLALAELERIGKMKSIITQNVDGLHQMAGSKNVIEFHGNFAEYSCINCHQSIKSAEISLETMPPKCDCGGIIRPDCVFFGEPIPESSLKEASSVSMKCDLMLVIGTSATVEPAASIPIIAKSHGSNIIEINPEPTGLTHHTSDLFVCGKAGDMMKQIIDEYLRY